MPVINGVGYGDYTPDKQADFQSLLSLHVDIVDRITGRPGKEWQRFYTYIDMNAGPGCYNEMRGSPLIFIDRIKTTTIPCLGIFIEELIPNACELGALVKDCEVDGELHVITGDHNLILRSKEYLPSRATFGLIYHDPSGHVPNFDLLAEISRYPVFKYMEIMVYLSASNIKRVRRYEETTGSDARTQLLTDYLQGINKDTWIIRKPQGKHQWTFAIGSNWKKFPQWQRIGFHRVDSEVGQEILKTLTYTDKERNAMSGQLDFFQLARPGDAPYYNYAEYLRHPRFLEIRADAMRRANEVCQVCKRAKATQVHHLRYPPWGTFDVVENLQPICYPCHCKEHGKEK